MKHSLLPQLSRSRASVLGASASLLFLAACSSGTEPRDPLQGVPPAGQLQLQLTRADSCDELLVRIQDDLIVPLAERAKLLRNPQNGGNGYATGTDGAVPPMVALPGVANNAGEGVPMTDAVAPLPSAPQPGPAAQGSAGMAPSGAPVAVNPNSPATSSDPDVKGEEAAPGVAPTPGGGFSGTTVQVADIDEADIVKADGDRIYLLHGGTMFVLRGWPANSTSILGSALVEGEPTEMFVHDGKAVIFSRVYLDRSQGSAATQPVPNDYYYYGGASTTKVTVLDVTVPQPSTVRESYLEGEYISARRHDGLVRAVVQNGFKVPQLGNPYIEYVDPFGHPFPQQDIDAQVDAWLERTADSIRNTEIGDWLPREYSRVNGALVEQPTRCGDYYSPDPGLTEQGVTSVVALDLAEVSAPLRGATILGRAERVYSNQDALLITQTDYRYQLVQGSSEQTIIHRFDLQGGDTSYVASGAVAGTIHDQFSLDERDGVIRVSTTEQNFGLFPLPAATPTMGPIALTSPPIRPPSGPVNRVVTLGTEGESLVQLGATEDFGLNESIYSTRFIGDLGYVVTFRQIDPLMVVDLSDPRQPTVVGELKVPGYSSFLFPFGEDHLFAIGQDATPEGRVQGLSLSLFDVSDPANPSLAQRYTYAESGASPANISHHALSFHSTGNVVAFPYRSYDTGTSTLEVFQLSVQDGFTRLGGMAEPVDVERCLRDQGYAAADAAAIATGQADPTWREQLTASCGWNREFRRGLFRDDFVYGISNNGVYAYELGAMDAGAVGQLRLPEQVWSQSGGGSSGGVAPPMMTAPSGGAAAPSAPVPSMAPTPAPAEDSSKPN
ncbi:MAG: hypothetical protein RL685_5783 [Pseudomonadota bacterium]|jgi:uncharacterized secreted protein with C-terminal beta-propeller domain